MRKRTLKLAFAAGATLLAVTLGPITIAAASPFGTHQPFRGPGHHGYDKGSAVVSVESSPYGAILVVGGPGAGYVPADPTTDPPTPAMYNYAAGTALYLLSSDPLANAHGPYQSACPATFNVSAQTACTSTPSSDTGEWPALTTDGPPIAGPGVNPWLLGTVYRADLGTFQVTYAGHPLYLFDQTPDSYVGQHFLETVGPYLPPWGGLWSLVTPSGVPAPGVADLESETPAAGQTVYSTPVVGVQEYPNAIVFGIPPVTVSVYAFSSDSPWQSRCDATCLLTWIPVLTSGAPTVGAGLNKHGAGVIRRNDGSFQVTYDGHPLYIYGQEQPAVGAGGPLTTGTVGNGNGVHEFGGTFTLVQP